jgi:stage II sporulation protein D
MLNHPTDRQPRTSTTALRGERARHAFVPLVAGVCLLLATCTAAALGAAAAGAATESVQFNLNGRGYGHGIGMSQWGAYGYAKNGWKWDAIIKHYYTGVSIGDVPNSVIRVLLADSQSSVKVTAATDFTVAGGQDTRTIPGGTQAVATPSGNGCLVAAGGQTWSFAESVTFSPGSSLLLLANRNQNGYINTTNMHYRGSLRVVRSGSGLTVVNHVPLEQYLYAVVPREVGSTWPAEALKAQAVAARSFGAQRIGSAGLFDVYCTTRSQAYGGADGEAAATNAAVDGTRGKVPTWKGKPIGAYYFDTSGGHTENVENIWAGPPVPYLKGVDDPYDTYSPYHSWPENPIRRSAATIARQLGSGYAPPGVLQTIYVTRRGVSPRIVQAFVVGTKGSRATTGAILRVRLGLRDTWFDVRTLSMAPYSAKQLVITYGQPFELRGRTFPALGATDKLVLRYRVGAVWRSATVPPERILAKSLSLGSGRTAKYAAYSCPIAPKGKTVYAFGVGNARSPQVTVAVRAQAALAAPQSPAAVGRQSLFAATAGPASLAGVRVALQLRETDGWKTVAQAPVGAGGAAQLPWTPTVNGTFSLRLAVPGAKGLLGANSRPVSVVVGGSPEPSPSTSPATSRIAFPGPPAR